MNPLNQSQWGIYVIVTQKLCRSKWQRKLFYYFTTKKTVICVTVIGVHCDVAPVKS